MIYKRTKCKQNCIGTFLPRLLCRTLRSTLRIKVATIYQKGGLPLQN